MERSTIKEILIPNWFQVVICCLGSLTIFVFFYREAIGQRLISQAESLSIKQDYTSQLTQLNKLPYAQTVVLVLFWAAVGLVAYYVYLLISNALVKARNEVVIDTSYTNQGSAISKLKALVFQLLVILTGIGFVWASFMFGFPAWLNLCTIILFTLTPISVATFLAGFLGLAINLYLFWVLAQLFKVARLE